MDKLEKFIYENRPLYTKNSVSEKDLDNKSLNELLLLKESERDYLSLNVPTALAIIWLMFIFDDFLWKLWFFILLIIVLVNLAIAVEEKKENISIYNKVINKKLKEKESKEEKYKKEISSYLKSISENIK